MDWRIQRILELMDITGKRNDPALRAMLRRLMLRPNQRLEEMLLRQLTALAGEEAFDPCAFRVPAQHDLAVPGSEGLPYIGLGELVKLVPDGIKTMGDSIFPLASGHSGWFGANRMGKTMAVRQMLALLPRNIRCLIIDSENDPAYSDLALSRPAEEFQVIDWRDWKIGLFAGPAGTAQEVWDGQVSRNLGESKFLRDGSKSMLLFLLNHCRRERPGPVALRQLYEKLVDLRYRLTQSGREYTFYESLKNRFEGLLTNRVFDCTVGFETGKLVVKDTLLRCRGMSSDDYTLAVNDLLLRLACHFQPDLSPVPKLVVVVEELHRMTNPQRLRKADTFDPVVLDAARTLAKCGVHIAFVDQVPSEVPAAIFANCTFRAVFNTFEGRDLEAIQRSMSLDWEQRATLSRLPKQVCLVSYVNPAFPEPFLVKIQDCPVGLPDPEAVEERMKVTLANLEWVPFEADQVRRPRVKPLAQEALPLISMPALEYLRDIAKDQFLAVSKRDERRGTPISQGNALRKELLEADLIALEEVNTYGKSRRIINTQLTEKGYTYLKSLGIQCERPKGRGGWEHLFHQQAIAAWGRANGYVVQIEHFHNGKSVDVGLEKDGVRIAVEILCVGVEKELSNLRDLHTGYSEIWFCVADMKTARKLRDSIARQFGEEAQVILSRVQFRLLGEFQDAGVGREDVTTGS